MMVYVPRVSLLLLMVSCANVRPITYPSPCLDRGAETRCMILGYEVWGSPAQVHAQAKECPRWTRAQVTLDSHGDYGVVRCYSNADAPAAAKKIAVIVELEKDEPPPPPDLEISLKEAEAPLPKEELKPSPAPPEPALRDQPRVPRGKAKRKRRARAYTDD